MARKGLYLPLDVNFFENERVIRAGERAAYLYLAMCCRAKQLQSDGVLSVIHMGRLNVPDWKKRLVRLVDNDLVWHLEDSRFWICGWNDRNDSRAEVESRRAADAARKRSERGIGVVSVRTPTGLQRESLLEKRREEKEEVRTCGHGAVDTRLCALCRAAS